MTGRTGETTADNNDNSDKDIDRSVQYIIASHSLDKTKLINTLQLVQQEFGYLSREALSSISRHLRVPPAELFGVATFYEQFRFNKPGKHTVRICEGTACHVKGGAMLSQTIERELKIDAGETTEDGLFTLDRVACLGCCALAPVMVVDETAYGYCTPAKISDILNSYKEGD